MESALKCGYDPFTALALIPFILLIIASFTDNQWATVNGFSFWPAKWSMEAYNYIASSGNPSAMPIS